MFMRAEYLDKWGPDDPPLAAGQSHSCIVHSYYKMPPGIANRDFVYYGQDIVLDDGKSLYSFAFRYAAA